MFHTRAWRSMLGSRMPTVCSSEKPIRRYVGSTVGSICTVIMPVTCSGVGWRWGG